MLSAIVGFLLGLIVSFLFLCSVCNDVMYGDKEFQKENIRILLKEHTYDISKKDNFTLRIEQGKVVTAIEDRLSEQIKKEN